MKIIKNNKILRIIIITICLILSLFGKFIPPIPGLSKDAMGVLYIFLSSIILWITIGIDWPSILCIFSLGLIDTLGFNKIFSISFGNSTLIFLIFTFICTYALSKTTIIKRTAIAFINSKLAKISGNCFVFLFLSAVLLLGLFISPTVLFVAMLPILNEILEVAKIDKKDKIAKTLLLGLGFTVSISSGMTPISHVFPVLAIEAAKLDISLIKYIGFALPTGLVIFILMFFMFKFILRPDFNKLKNIDVNEIKQNIPKIDLREIIILIIFCLVIALWVLPSLFEQIAPDFYNFFNKYGSAMPPLLGTILLCIIRYKDKPLIEITDAFKNGIPWASIIMCTATLALGSALTNDQIGIKSFLQTNLESSLKNIPEILLLIIFALWAILQTNVSSNMVTATLVATVAGTVLSSINTNLNINVVICIIGMLASFAFATPPSMPHIAIISGSETCDTKDVLLYGSILMLISLIIVLLIGYPLGNLFL